MGEGQAVGVVVWGAGAYLSGCSDGDVAPGMGFERLETVLAGRRGRPGGFRYSPGGPGLLPARVRAHDRRRRRSKP